jgi:heme o synthase
MSNIDLDLREGAIGARISEAMPRDYFELLKPRVMTLVVFTALGGLVAAPGGLDPVLALIAILSIAIGGGAAGALNMWYDADIDSVMGRTTKRPIPSGRISKGEALAFGLVLALFSVMTLALATNVLAGAMLAFTIFFYVVIYTMWLKRLTPQNIVIGGAAGAFPPMIGWAAVTGAFSWESALLFLIIFLWTPPHFWALALAKQKDYGAANVPMMPNAHGAAHTRLQILLYTLILTPLPLAGLLFNFIGYATVAVTVAGGACMLYWAFAVFRLGDGASGTKACWKLFGGSIIYLYALFAALIADHLIIGSTLTIGWMG